MDNNNGEKTLYEQNHMRAKQYTYDRQKIQYLYKSETTNQEYDNTI